MFDRELVLADLNNVLWSLDQIHRRFAAIAVPADFTKDDTVPSGTKGITAKTRKNSFFGYPRKVLVVFRFLSPYSPLLQLRCKKSS